MSFTRHPGLPVPSLAGKTPPVEISSFADQADVDGHYELRELTVQLDGAGAAAP
jgi:hypothetical protein